MNSLSATWINALAKRDYSVQAVLEIINNAGLRIALIVDDDGVLLGTVTDGDVRRAMLQGLDLSASAEMIMFNRPMVVTQDVAKDVVLRLMRANNLQQLPVVDEHGRPIGLHLWHNIVTPPPLPNTLLIMAGGFGRRLRPHTNEKPKPMLPVAGRPMLQHIIERAADEGFVNFVLCVFYLGHLIEDYFEDGGKWGINISYIRETEPLGTAGALSLLNPVPSDPVLVTNGDVLTDIRYREVLQFHMAHRADATMAIRPFEWQHPFGVVQTDGVKIVSIEEKPIYRTYVNAGIYVLNQGVLELLRHQEHCDMPTLFARARELNMCTNAYPIHEDWMDVGRAEDLERANERAC